MKQAILDDIKVGAKLKIFYSEDNINNRAFEIRAIVDDYMYVCKTWLTHKQRWHYFIEHYSWFEVFLPYLYLR